MKNKKGFTLIELIVIIIIIGVILVFSLPNVTSTLERQKKDAMIVDAKDFVHKTQAYMLKKMDYPTATEPTKFFCLSTTTVGGKKCNGVDPRKEIKDSPFGSKYKRDLSTVTVTYSSKEVLLTDKDGNTIYDESGIPKKETRIEYTYTIYLIDESNHKIDNINIDVLNTDAKYEKVS